MKILCVIDSLGSGGAQRQLVELAKGFKEKGHKVSFLTYHNINFFRPELEKYNITIHTILEPNYIKRFFKVRSAIRNHKADVVLSFLEAANFITTVSGFPYRKWKLIVGERSANPAILKSFKLRFYRFFHLFADYVVANSHNNLELVKKVNPLIKHNKAKVIYNIVDNQKWCGEKKKERINSSKLKITVAASHHIYKNAIGLIESVNLLSNEEKEKISICWYGAKRDVTYLKAIELTEKYNLKNIIEFLPETNKIKEFMLKSDIIGLFSFHEGFPNVICEAMTLGKPVISSAVSDLPLFIDKEYLFNPYDPKDISETISKIIKTDKKILIETGERNKIKALKLFNKELVTSSYLNLFE
ncbi:glycosyltransferase family 4 protein [Psychroflexus sp. YR1-1]|uniref:Glycosyltransferase family 4 protein n=1 Tax=Psychroflexus aurantiacus TaxID=2709310 RepID=A0A6B3QXH3_9FLAO|nr:glycosyltransferase family 4 protein [Psychroflexus aurantiacus]NEV92729.1 glycosyltransferase family 4 protein [Psychroflexus aurantiacus]